MAERTTSRELGLNGEFQSHQPNRFSVVQKIDRVFETEIARRKLMRLMTPSGWSG